MRASAPPQLTELYAPIQADLAEVERVFDAELASDLPFAQQLTTVVRSYRGKLLRPALVLLAGRACGPVTPGHHVLGAVVEMVHMATLVHDDVLDAADERRRQPTIARLEGNTAAVLFGDYLISHAFHLCSSLDSQTASREVGRATNVVCAGEMLQNQRRGDLALSEADYLQIIEWKTAALTAACCALGAQAAGGSPVQVAALRAYGLRAGVGFQIVDDVLDVVGDPAEVGKTLGLDARLGKATLPTIHCLSHAEPAVRDRLVAALGNGEALSSDAVRECLEATDSVTYALTSAEQHVRAALAELEQVPVGPARTALTALAEFIIERRV